MEIKPTDYHRLRTRSVGLPPPSRGLLSETIRDEGRGRPLADYSGLFRPAQVQVYFRDLEAALCGHIRQAGIVAGAVAWLTSEPILDALASVPRGVALVVQKEDFLRPDVAANPGWAGRLRAMYDRLKSPPERHSPCWPVFGGMSGCCDPTVQPVRCVGNHNRDRHPAFPRMHHKFLVFCDSRRPAPCGTPECDEWGGCERCGYGFDDIQPYAVWTGSFNLTRNAAASFENAVYIPDPATASAYFHEWGQIMALSEPLDWESDWCAPEWRIGT